MSDDDRDAESRANLRPRSGDGQLTWPQAAAIAAVMALAGWVAYLVYRVICGGPLC